MRRVKFFGITLVIAMTASLGVILGATNAAEATIPDTFLSAPVENTPWGVALSPDGTKAYVANFSSNTVSEVSTETGAFLRKFNVGGNPKALAVTPNGEKLFVANYSNGTVSEIDLLLGGTRQLPVGKYPSSVAISPNGTTAYVTNSNGSTISDSGTVSVIGIAPSGSDSTVQSTVTVNGGPTAIALSPDGNTGYITLSQLNKFVSVDLRISTFPEVKSIVVGSNPTSVVVSSDAQAAFVGNELGNTVTAVWLNKSITDPTASGYAMRNDGTVTVGTGPSSLALSPNMGYLYVTNSNDGTVSVINTSLITPGPSSSAVEETINVGAHTLGVAASPDGSKIFVTAMSDYTNPGTLEVINVASPMALTLHVTDTSGPYTLPIQGLWGTISWGDGTFSSHYAQSNIAHVYPSTGTYLLTITGGATGYGSFITGKKGKVTSVASWGDFSSDPSFISLDSAFVLEPELTALPADFPAYVVSASYMFTGADRFNQDISTWDVSELVNMRGMFYGTLTFDAPIGNWDISSANDVADMFKEAYAFNQDISGWHTNQLFYFDSLFEDAESFNQDLSSWSIQSLTSATNFLDGTAMSPLNYSKLLRAWSQQTVNSEVQLDAHDSMYYTSIDYFRDYLIEEKGWTIVDDGPTVIPAATLVTAPNASSIYLGQQTQASSLSGGVASQPGTFSFVNPTEVLSSGAQTVTVRFIPADPIFYAPFTTSVNVNVIAPVSPTNEQSAKVNSPTSALINVATQEISPAPAALNQTSGKSSQVTSDPVTSSKQAAGSSQQTQLLWLFGGAGFTLIAAAVIYFRARTRAKIF